MLDALEPQADRLDWTSLSIEMRVPIFPYAIGYWEGPAYFDIPALRILFHETVHLWQMLSMGFLTNLAVESWHSLLKFESTGEINTFTSLQNRLEEHHPELGFSAFDLIETLARFWDIHVLSPARVRDFELGQRSYHSAPPDPQPRLSPFASVPPYTGEEFDAVMTVASYNEPYRRAINKWGSAGAVVMFPMVAYFSLQSPNPTKVYYQMENLIARPVPFERGISIHTEWRQGFLPVQELANSVSLVETGSYLTPGWDVLRRNRLIGPRDDQDRIYWLYRLSLDQMISEFGVEETNRCFCFPGDMQYRGNLLAYALPPRVVLFGGSWSPTPLVADKVNERLGNIGMSEVTYDILAAHAEDINRRVRAMRKRAAIQQIAALAGNPPSPR